MTIQAAAKFDIFGRLSGLEATISGLEATISGLEATVSGLEATMSGLEATTKKQQDSIERLEAASERQAEAIGNLKNTVIDNLRMSWVTLVAAPLITTVVMKFFKL